MIKGIGVKLLHRLCVDQDAYAYHQLHLSAEYFVEPQELEFYQAINTFAEKYNKLPSVETLASWGFHEQPPTEPPTFYADLIEQRRTHKVISSFGSEIIQKLKAGPENTGYLVDRLTALASEMGMSKYRSKLVEFSEQGADVYKAYWGSKNNGLSPLINLGWTTIDASVGSLIAGDVVSILGRPGAGKTYLLLHSALSAWRQGKDVLFVSMEMPVEQIVTRLSAMYLHLPVDHLKKAQLTEYQKTLTVTGLSELNVPGAPKFWIMDGNLAATVPEVFSLVRQLQPSSVYLDGAYMLQHSDKRLNRYQRVAENAEMIKSSAASAGIPAACTWQFNRDAAKKMGKKGSGDEDVGLEDIGYSDVIGQVSSIVLGLFQAEDIESGSRRKVTVLKGREGETGAFHIHWDFIKMNFDEVPDGEKEAELNYI